MEETRDRSDPRIRHHRHGRRAALGLAGLVVAAALLAPAGALADRPHESGRHRPGEGSHHIARVAPAPRGPEALRGRPAEGRFERGTHGDRSTRPGSWERWAHERREAHRRAERLAFRREHRPHMEQRHRVREARPRSRAPAMWVQVTWSWPFPH